MRLPTPILTKYETTLVLIPESFAIPINFGLFFLVFDIHFPFTTLLFSFIFMKNLLKKGGSGVPCARKKKHLHMLLPVRIPLPLLPTNQKLMENNERNSEMHARKTPRNGEVTCFFALSSYFRPS